MERRVFLNRAIEARSALAGSARIQDLDLPSRLLLLHLAGLGALLLLWLAFAGVVMPWLLRLAHEGRELPLLSSLMSGRDATPLETYFETWRGFADGVTLILVMFVVLSIPLVLTLPSFAARLESGRTARWSERDLGLVWAGSVASVVLAVVLLSYAAPVAYVYAITEDYWVEHATFVAFMSAGGLFVWAAVLQRGYRRLGPLALGLVALAVGLEEVSWGQRLLGFETPEALEQYNYQGEFTLHNIWFPRYVMVGAFVAFAGVALPFLVRRWDWIRKPFDRLAVPIPRSSLAGLFLLTGGLFAMSAYAPPFLKIDEVAELALGVCALLLGVDTAVRAGTNRRVEVRTSFLSGAGTMVVLVGMTGILVHLAPYPASLRFRLNEMATFRYPDQGLYGQADRLFRYMERNPEYQLPLTRVEYGRFLMERGDTARASGLLSAALEDQRRRLIAEPWEAADAWRKQARIYQLLELQSEADMAIERSLTVDYEQLKETRDGSEAAVIHWSLARTNIASGRDDEARRHTSLACELTASRHVRIEIRRWSMREGPGVSC